MADLFDRDAPDDDDAPTRLQRPPRVQLHPKLDPRKIPTLRRVAVVRSLAAPAAAPEAPPLGRRGGISLAWVVVFIATAYAAILVALFLALR